MLCPLFVAVVPGFRLLVVVPRLVYFRLPLLVRVVLRLLLLRVLQFVRLLLVRVRCVDLLCRFPLFLMCFLVFRLRLHVEVP